MNIKISSKKQLAKILSSFLQVQEPKVRDEQYQTDSEICADILWNAYLMGDCEGKVIVDLGCGNGCFGIGTLILGAKKVIFIDKDEKSIEISKKNYENIKSEYKINEAEFLETDAKEITQEKIGNQNIAVLFQNPPFGTKQKHNDLKFLEKAIQISPIVYTIHKSSTKEFINKFINKSKYKITNYIEMPMSIKKTMKFHRQKSKKISIGIWRIQKF